jgi:pSer/pThr/pTyr-binding forkhead associated (FHA) protein
VLVERDGRWLVEDQGSLNGTFVNRRRVESAELADGDELQIGKYRLTFLTR